jgi:hypothetical protein
MKSIILSFLLLSKVIAGTAAFIIDDTEVQNRNASVFIVCSTLQPFQLKRISSLKSNQEKIETSLPSPCLITVIDSNVKRCIRYGLNQNNGASQTDIFMVDKNGKVDMNAPTFGTSSILPPQVHFPSMKSRSLLPRTIYYHR